jgi:hypothetical protein
VSVVNLTYAYGESCHYSSINNVLGPRWTLILGTLGYSLYIASFLYDDLYVDPVMLLKRCISVLSTSIPTRVLLLSQPVPSSVSVQRYFGPRRVL